MSAPRPAIARSAASRACAGARSISTLAFSPISRIAAAKMIAATSSAATESPSAKPAAHGEQPGEHRQRAGHVAGEVKARWSAAPGCRSAAPRAARRVVAARGRRASAIAITANWYQWSAARAPPPSRWPDRLDADEQRPRRADRRLAERAEVLGAAVAVGVPADRRGARRGARRRTSARRRSRRRWTRSRPRSARGCRSPARRRASAPRAGRRRRSRPASCAAGCSVLAGRRPRPSLETRVQRAARSRAPASHAPRVRAAGPARPARARRRRKGMAARRSHQ